MDFQALHDSAPASSCAMSPTTLTLSSKLTPNFYTGLHADLWIWQKIQFPSLNICSCLEHSSRYLHDLLPHVSLSWSDFPQIRAWEKDLNPSDFLGGSIDPRKSPSRKYMECSPEFSAQMRKRTVFTSPFLWLLKVFPMACSPPWCMCMYQGGHREQHSAGQESPCVEPKDTIVV